MVASAPVPEVVGPHRAGADDQQALLLERAVDQRGHVVLAVAEGGDALRGADVAHELPQHVGQRVRPRVVDRLPGQQLGDLVVALRRGLVGEAERGRRGDDHRVPVRDERVVVRVAGRLVGVLERGDRIGAGVRDVHAG